MDLGIETTAHTLSFGLVDHNGIPYPAASDTLRPDQGGIHPREAADHHKDVAAMLFQRVLEEHDLSTDDIGAVAYSQGPVSDLAFVSVRPSLVGWPHEWMFHLSVSTIV